MIKYKFRVRSSKKLNILPTDKIKIRREGAFYFNENGRNQLKWTETSAREWPKQHSAQLFSVLLSIRPKLTKSIIRSKMIRPFQIRPKEAPPDWLG
jgi:hypothetical protein